MGQIYVPYSSSSSSACFIRLSLDTRTGSSDSKLRMSLWRGWDNFLVSKATVLWTKHKINTSSNLFNSILPLKFENVIRESPLYLFKVTWSVPLNSKRLSSVDGAIIIEGWEFFYFRYCVSSVCPTEKHVRGSLYVDMHFKTIIFKSIIILCIFLQVKGYLQDHSNFGSEVAV